MKNNTKSTRWTCDGSVRGCCGVLHRTLDAAQAHCDKDGGDVSRAYPSTYPTRAYSDRRPVELEPGEEI